MRSSSAADVPVRAYRGPGPAGPPSPREGRHRPRSEARRSGRAAACGPRSSRSGSREPGTPPTGVARPRSAAPGSAMSGSRARSLEGPLVVRVPHADEPGMGRPSLETLEKGGDGTEGQPRVAPVDRAQGLEAVLLDRLHQPGMRRGPGRWSRRRCRRGRGGRPVPRSGPPPPDAAGAARRRRTSSSAVKATWSMSRLRPMPMASVATRWSTSPDW